MNDFLKKNKEINKPHGMHSVVPLFNFLSAWYINKHHSEIREDARAQRRRNIRQATRWRFAELESFVPLAPFWLPKLLKRKDP